MALLPVQAATDQLLRGIEPLAPEQVELSAAAGRVLAADLRAVRTQPPFPASAMDGYAVRAADAAAGASLAVIGESRAGKRFSDGVATGQAVRIFTGAPVPDGADAILIQENARVHEDRIAVLHSAEPSRFIRRAGLDFRTGDLLLTAGRQLDSRAIALAAAMGYGVVPVRRRPRVAILSNGDELVPPGANTGPDQIVSSNGVGLAAFVRACGGEPIDLGIAPDDPGAITGFVKRAEGVDVLVVIGGASVGDHDLVKGVLAGMGMALDFWRIAMRPGKPLMVGSLHGMRVLGLPGNPVSALVCGQVFLKPLIRAMLGLNPAPVLARAILDAPLPANDERQDYLRSRVELAGDARIATAFPVQDSSMLSALASADALLIRPPHAPAARAGEEVDILILSE